MKLTSIELHPENSSQVVALSFRDPGRLNPYNVKSITGLDASGIVPRYYGASGNKRDNFFNLSLDKRELAMVVELNPPFGEDKSYSDLRDDLYKMIASSRTGLVQVQFKKGVDVVAAISGMLMKFEASLFDKTPSVTITIKANEPTLKALAPTVVDVAGLDPAALIFTDDISTAPHGFDMQLNVTAPIETLVIFDPLAVTDDLLHTPLWSFTLAPETGFLIGDIIYFGSDLGNKKLFVGREGVGDIQLADAVVGGSVWPMMFPGENHLKITPSANVTIAALSYLHTYWGV